MTKTPVPLVAYSELQAEGYPTAIRINSPAWFDWLVNHRSFRYECSRGHFTACKENRKGGNFWYANRRVDGKLRRAYLGASVDLTLEKLEEVAIKLSGSDRTYEQRKSHTKTDCVTDSLPTSQAVNQELLNQLSELQKELDQQKAANALLEDELGEARNMLTAFQNFKVSEVDLTATKIYQLHKRPVVRLEDLEKLGYRVIHPEWHHQAASLQVMTSETP